MPGGDGTGPMGMGPMTGRAFGFCAGYGAPEYMNQIPRRGFGAGLGPSTRLRTGCGRGFGGGGGRGWRNMFHATGLPGWARGAMPYAATPAPEQELAVLKQQAEYFDNALEDIRKRIQEIESQPAAK